MTNFFDLPGEIRNQVYSYAHQDTLVNLRGTSRQLHAETYNLSPPVKVVAYRPDYSSNTTNPRIVGRTAPSEYHLAKLFNENMVVSGMAESMHQGRDQAYLEAGGDPKRILDNRITYRPVSMKIPLLVRMRRFFVLQRVANMFRFNLG